MIKIPRLKLLHLITQIMIVSLRQTFLPQESVGVGKQKCLQRVKDRSP